MIHTKIHKITWANEMIFLTPGAGLISQPIDLQSSELPLCFGCPYHRQNLTIFESYFLYHGNTRPKQNYKHSQFTSATSSLPLPVPTSC